MVKFRVGDRVRRTDAGTENWPHMVIVEITAQGIICEFVNEAGTRTPPLPRHVLELVTPDPARKEEPTNDNRRKPYGFGGPAVPTSKAFGR